MLLLTRHETPTKNLLKDIEGATYDVAPSTSLRIRQLFPHPIRTAITGATATISTNLPYGILQLFHFLAVFLFNNRQVF